MSNTIDSGLVVDTINGGALQAFTSLLAPANAFSRKVGRGGEKSTNVPLFNVDSAGDFADDYTGGDSTVDGVTVTADQHKIAAVHSTDLEALDHSDVDLLEGLGFQAGAA